MANVPAGTAYVQPLAGWQVTLDGQDITDRLSPHLVSLALTETRGEKADRLTLTLHDADGALALPPEGAIIAVSLGWQKGTGVTPGLVPKGSFKVDDITWQGPPDRVTINAHSADLADSFRTRKNRTWNSQTLGAITGKVAGDNGLSPRCHPDLAGTTVTSAEQANQSDMEFLRDLGRRYDAVATVKAGALIFAPVDATTTASGAALPTLAITRKSGDRYTYRRAAREGAQQGAEAQHYDQDGAQRQTASAGGGNKRRLKRVYAGFTDANAAAKSEWKRLKRAAASFELTLAYGDATVAAAAKATLSGFKSEIDEKKWLLASVEHTITPDGFHTRVEMEVAG